jgi:hypothetical protein
MIRRFSGFAFLGAALLMTGLGTGLVTGCASSSSSSPSAAGSPTLSASGSPTAPASSGSPAAPTTSPATSSAASGQAVGVPSCATSQLTVSLGTSQGTAGSIYQTIDFTNNGSSSCTLYGYPGVSLQGGSPATQIGAAAARDTTTTPSLVTLAHGAVANAVVQVTVAGNYPSSTCNPAPASSLLVYPPGETVPASVSYPTTGCSSTSVILLHVGPVQVGNGSSG